MNISIADHNPAKKKQMGFINELRNETNKLWEKYCISDGWTVDYARKVYLDCSGTNRFGYTTFVFYWDVDFTDPDPIDTSEMENYVVLQARRELDKPGHRIHYRVYLPELDGYSDTFIALLKEAIETYGLRGQPVDTAWAVSMEFIAEKVPYYYPKTAFVNEKISQELLTKYGIRYENYRCPKRWTIDRQRDIILMLRDRYPPENYTEFLLFWHGQYAGGFSAGAYSYRDEWDVRHLRYRVTDLWIQPEWSDRRQDVLAMMEEAVRIYGDSGNVIPENTGELGLEEDEEVEFDVPDKFKEGKYEFSN